MDGNARQAATIKLAAQLGAAGEEREAAEAVLIERQEECKAAREAEREASKAYEAIQEKINHLVGLLIGNERGQLPLDFGDESTPTQRTFDDPAPTNSDVPELPNSDAPAAPVTKNGKPIDEGGRQPLSVLLKFGLTQSKLEAFQSSKYGDTVKTVAELERLIRDTNGFYWKEVSGWGEKFVTGDGPKEFVGIHLAFRQAWPVPAELEVVQRKRCLKCSREHLAKRCPQCKSSTWEAIPDESSPVAGGSP